MALLQATILLSRRRARVGDPRTCHRGHLSASRAVLPREGIRMSSVAPRMVERSTGHHRNVRSCLVCNMLFYSLETTFPSRDRRCTTHWLGGESVASTPQGKWGWSWGYALANEACRQALLAAKIFQQSKDLAAQRSCSTKILQQSHDGCRAGRDISGPRLSSERSRAISWIFDKRQKVNNGAPGRRWHCCSPRCDGGRFGGLAASLSL
jgi:hypothetical protein